MVVNISVFVEKETVKRAIELSDMVRNLSLAYCYNIVPGYKNISRKSKNKIYDRVKEKFEKALA